MADPKMQAAYDGLVERFVLPLVEGGEVEVGRPIAPGCAAFFAATTPSSEDARLRIYTALIDAADEIHDIDMVPWPSGTLTWLAAAAHNLCALTDPSLDRVFVRGARDTIGTWADRWLELIPPPLTRGDALARHALLSPMLALKRTDTVVKNWAYTYRFFGRRPPANVVALPTLRFVKTFESEVGIDALIQRGDSLHLEERRRALLSRSPVSELLSCTTLPAFRFSIATLTVLGDVGLRSGIAKGLAGLDGAGEIIAAALSQPELSAEPALLRIALSFVLELHMVRALDGGTDRIAGARTEAGMLFDALLHAAFEDDADLETLRQLDDSDRALLQARVEQLRVANPAILQQAAALHRAASR
jgi:hypothetical protein